MKMWTGADQKAEEWFRKTYGEEYEKLVRYAVSSLKARNNKTRMLNRAEDVVQEVFALAWERRGDVLSHEKPVGWLYITLQYKVRALLKEESRWTNFLLRYEPYYHQSMESYIDLKLELEALISREDYDLLYKIYIMGYTYQELCDEMGLTKSTLGVRVHRIKKRLQEKHNE